MKKFYYFYYLTRNKKCGGLGRYSHILVDEGNNIYDVETKEFIGNDPETVATLMAEEKAYVVYYDDNWNLDVKNITCAYCGERMEGISILIPIIVEQYFDFEEMEITGEDEQEDIWESRVYICPNCREEIPHKLLKEITKQLPKDWEG